MTDTVRDQATTALAEVEKVTLAIMPEVNTTLVTLDAAPVPQADEIKRRMAEIDMTNTQSIISFGAGSQAELQNISQAMLAGVKNKDVGPAGDSLTEIVSTIRGFSGEELDVNRERSWWERLTGAAAPLAHFMAR
ncbi:MAG: toxic anion resistance protein, partial [Candidatus Saccharibacteria bacterium]|nr:toxic anion resistance protein [Pseudorhodobacter sp.]